MKIKKIFYLSTSTLLSTLIYPQKVFAAMKCNNPALDFQCLEDMFTSVLNNIVAGASIVFLVMIFSGGLKYLTSSGDPKDIENAKGRMTFSALGLGAMILCWFILKFLDIFLFGGNNILTIFSVPHP